MRRSRKAALASAQAPPQAVAPSLPEAAESSQLPARLLESPFEFRFFQAVRLLHLLLPDRSPVGRFGEPHREVARFHSHQSLGFPASEIQTLRADAAGPPEMAVNFMGLTGPVGVMPVFYTAWVLERLRSRDATAAAFFDIFNHRMISLFYRAWEKHRFHVSYERGESAGVDRYLPYFAGLGSPGLADRLEVSDESLKFYAGLICQQPRSAAALEALLADYFQAPVAVVQFVGVWRKLDYSSLCRLEDDPEEVPAARLGYGAVAGDEVRDQQSTARLRIGPLPLSRYLQFLPGGDAFTPLCELARFFARDEIDFEVQLVLERTHTPGVCLGAEGDQAPLLGWVSWIKNQPIARDPDDTRFQI